MDIICPKQFYYFTPWEFLTPVTLVVFHWSMSNRPIDPAVRVFAKDRKTGRPGGQSQVESDRRLKNGTCCLTLSIIRYESRVKWSNLGDGVAPSPTPLCSCYWKRSLWIRLHYSHHFYFMSNRKFPHVSLAVGGVEYIDCFSSKG